MTSRKHLLVVALLVILNVDSGCTDEPTALFVLGNVVLQSDCSAAPSVTGPWLSRGVMDVSLTNNYLLHPTVQNVLPRSGSTGIPQEGSSAGSKGEAAFTNMLVEGNNISITGARISYTTPPNFPVPMPEQTIAVSAAVLANDGMTALWLEVVPVDVGNALAESGPLSTRGSIVPILVHVVFEGISSSGTLVESNEFTYPIDICNGCLVYFSPDADDLTQEGPDCKATTESSSSSSAIPAPCLFGQDGWVDCRLCHAFIGDETLADQICEPH